ncbi:MAG: helix-turn-helix domain-containing protein [Marmoricola sp.]
MLDLPPVINPRPEKRYSPRYLSEDERIRLADLRREKLSIRAIATLMDRSPSTISLELRRGCDAAGRYRPHEAQRRALARRCLRRPSRLCRDEALRGWVATKLKARWSPEQISHELGRAFPDQPRRWLCTESIYQAVYRPDLGGQPRELPGRVLRHRRRHRVPHRHAQARRSGPVTGMMKRPRFSAVPIRGAALG